MIYLLAEFWTEIFTLLYSYYDINIHEWIKDIDKEENYAEK